VKLIVFSCQRNGHIKPSDRDINEFAATLRMSHQGHVPISEFRDASRVGGNTPQAIKRQGQKAIPTRSDNHQATYQTPGKIMVRGLPAGLA
jgi:hypothetical protein